MPCNDVHSCRTASTIAWNCISTMVLCTWVALHPDVPENSLASLLERLRARTGYMILALLAPEVVLFKALTNWLTGCFELRALLDKSPDCGWTETHAMFAYMGGFRLVGTDGSKQRLVAREFFTKVQEGKIEIPAITEGEIWDKSKGDEVAKVITLLQTLSFGIQAVYRAANGLTVTTLELTVLGHIVLNLFIFWFWFNKPLDIRFPVDVHRKKQEEQPSPLTERAEQPSPAEPHEIIPNVQPEPESQIFARRPASMRVRIGAYIEEILFAKRLEQSWESVVVSIACSILGGLFGAIHCLAWNATFPADTQSFLWRLSSIIVTVTPGLFFTFVTFHSKPPEDAVTFFAGLGIICYCFSRACLLVVALTTLRALPYKALQTPAWPAYIPQIS